MGFAIDSNLSMVSYGDSYGNEFVGQCEIVNGYVTDLDMIKVENSNEYWDFATALS